jgi:hypothetical protein
MEPWVSVILVVVTLLSDTIFEIRFIVICRRRESTWLISPMLSSAPLELGEAGDEFTACVLDARRRFVDPVGQLGDGGQGHGALSIRWQDVPARWRETLRNLDREPATRTERWRQRS